MTMEEKNNIWSIFELSARFLEVFFPELLHSGEGGGGGVCKSGYTQVSYPCVDSEKQICET